MTGNKYYYIIWMPVVLTILTLTTLQCCHSFVVPSTPSRSSSVAWNCKNVHNHYHYGMTLISRHMAIAAEVTIATKIDTDTISVTLPSNWRTDSKDDWSIQAADILNRYGVVALSSSSSNDSNSGLISTQTIERANQSAISRLQDMQSRIVRRGVDPYGIEHGPYRFAEIICRDEGGLRYDVPLPWLGQDDSDNYGDSNTNNRKVGSGRIGAPLTGMESEGVMALHKAMDEIVPHVLDALWSRDGENNDDDDDDDDGRRNNYSCSYVAAAGFLINKPGSNSQSWHKDGPDEGFIDCFVPLIDLNSELGPTSFLLGDEDHVELVPMLNKGSILLFDYRTMHRGQANTSEATTRTLAYAVYRRREMDENGIKKESGDVHNFPAALTLEYD
jgi:hypothetical protein